MDIEKQVANGEKIESGTLNSRNVAIENVNKEKIFMTYDGEEWVNGEELKNTIYYGSDEPNNPKKGDKWYKDSTTIRGGIITTANNIEINSDNVKLHGTVKKADGTLTIPISISGIEEGLDKITRFNNNLKEAKELIEEIGSIELDIE